MRPDFRGDVAASSDRNADDDEIGAGDRGGVAFDDLIGKSEFGNAPPRGGGACGRDDLANCPWARAARAIDEPIKPTPIRARRL